MKKRALISVVIAGIFLASVLVTGFVGPAAAGTAPPGKPMASPLGLGTDPPPLPTSVNLSSELPPVGDQTDIFPGSQYCHTWACCYYMMTQYVKHFLHPEWDLSDPQHVFGVMFPAYNGGDHYVLQNQGNVDIAEMPYDPSLPDSKRPTPAQREAAKQYRIGSYYYLWDYGQSPPLPLSISDEAITNAKAWLASGHVLDVGIKAFVDFPLEHDHSQDTHFYDPTSPVLTQNIGHQVDLVGYDDNINPGGADADHRGGFLMVNCWGTDWNGDMHGFIWVSYAYVKHFIPECSVISSMPSDKPSISGCTDQAGVGDTIAISGNNFGTNRRAAAVSVNGVPATDMVWTNEAITAKVPWNATSGPVVVYDWEGTPSNAAELRIDHSAPTLASITPATGAAGSRLIMPDLTGTGFFGAPVVKLKKAGQADIVSSSVQVTSATKAICSFDLTGADPGDWDVCVENPDGKSVTKRAAFRVTAPTWYLAEGSTAWGFDTHITIENPNDVAVHAKVTYINPSAAAGVGKLAVKTIALPALSQTTITSDAVTAAMGGPSDFSTIVECVEGETIAVDRTVKWTGPGAPSQEAHSSVGTTSPSKTWYLPEGSSAWGFETWTLVENPGPTDAHVTLTYMAQDGLQMVVQKTVSSLSRASWSMAADLGAPKDASIKVQSDVPVIAEGSTYRDNRREGSCSIGATSPATDYYLSEGSTAWGFTTYILVENPNPTPTDVTLTYHTPDGPVAQPAFTMPAGSRKTVRVNDALSNTDFSTRVHGSAPIIAERSMYWGAGTAMGEACHASIGISSPHMTFYLPDGRTMNGHETYTLVENPNPAAVRIAVYYLPQGGGKVVQFTDEIPAGSRQTYDMADKIKSGRASIVVQSQDGARPIIVERSMYWNNKGVGTNTVGAFTD